MKCALSRYSPGRNPAADGGVGSVGRGAISATFVTGGGEAGRAGGLASLVVTFS